MVRFKEEWACCKLCAGTKKGIPHSRLGGDDEAYKNCAFYGSTKFLSDPKKRSLELQAQCEAAHDTKFVFFVLL